MHQTGPIANLPVIIPQALFWCPPPRRDWEHGVCTLHVRLPLSTQLGPCARQSRTTSTHLCLNMGSGCDVDVEGSYIFPFDSYHPTAAEVFKKPPKPHYETEIPLLLTVKIHRALNL